MTGWEQKVNDILLLDNKFKSARMNALFLSRALSSVVIFCYLISSTLTVPWLWDDSREVSKNTTMSRTRVSLRFRRALITRLSNMFNTYVL